MEKSKIELLADYRKSNKVRRARIVEKSGKRTETAYLNYLVTADRIETTLSAPSKTVRTSTRAKAVDLVKKAVKKTTKEESLDAVIAFDTTGSMGSYLQAVKERIVEEIKKWFENIPNLKMKIVAFGDYCDMESKTKFGKAYQESPLTDDAATLIKFVRNAKSTSGGDSDEFYELVIKKITEETPWRSGKRSVLLIADCDPHQPGYTHSGIIENSQIDWRLEAKKAAKLSIPFDTLSIHGSKYPWYKELSEITGGVYLPFTSKSQGQTSELIGATMYARGASDAVYFTAVESASTVEMSAIFKTLSTLR